jgi:hypothetical protein
MNFKYSFPFEHIAKPLNTSIEKNIKESIKFKAKVYIEIPVEDSINGSVKFATWHKTNQYEFEDSIN